MVALHVIQDERRLVTGGDPGALYPVPRDWGEEEFQLAPDLEIIGGMLIASCPDLAHLHGATVKFQWQRKGQTKAGAVVRGVCQKPSGNLRFWSEADFLVVIAADHLVNEHFTRWQVEALVHETLCYADWDPKTDKPAVRGPEWSGFRANVLAYGEWRDELVEAADVFKQASLPGVR